MIQFSFTLTTSIVNTAAVVRDLVAGWAGRRARGGAGDEVQLSLGKVAGCFPRRETRRNASEMVSGLLMELEAATCWTIGEALGPAGPHRLRHLLSQAAWDDQQVLRRAAWAVEHLGDGESILIADETVGAKSAW